MTSYLEAANKRTSFILDSKTEATSKKRDLGDLISQNGDTLKVEPVAEI
jgi:hypothetical protein